MLRQWHSDTESKKKQDININKDDNFKASSIKYLDCQRNKGFILIFCICIIFYICIKNANLMQMNMGYFIFIQNMSKYCIKVFT